MEVLAGSGVGQGNLLAQAQGTVHTDTRHNHGGGQSMELGFTPGSIRLSSPFSLEYTHSTSQLLSVNILSLSLSSNFLCHLICPSLTVPPSLLLKASEHPFFIFEDLKYN